MEITDEEFQEIRYLMDQLGLVCLTDEEVHARNALRNSVKSPVVPSEESDVVPPVTSSSDDSDDVEEETFTSP